MVFSSPMGPIPQYVVLGWEFLWLLRHFVDEVYQLESTFPQVLSWNVFIVTVSYLIPLLVTWGATHVPSSNWIDGYLAKAAREIAGSWLG